MKPTYKRSRYRDWVFAVTHPNYWVRSYDTNAKWDKFLNDLLDTHPITFCPDYLGSKTSLTPPLTCKIGSITLWLGSGVDRYGHPYSPKEIQTLPYRRTAWRLKKRVKEAQRGKTDDEKIRELIENVCVENLTSAGKK